MDDLLIEIFQTTKWKQCLIINSLFSVSFNFLFSFLKLCPGGTSDSIHQREVLPALDSGAISTQIIKNKIKSNSRVTLKHGKLTIYLKIVKSYQVYCNRNKTVQRHGNIIIIVLILYRWSLTISSYDFFHLVSSILCRELFFFLLDVSTILLRFKSQILKYLI